ncbi:MAG TPA: polyribonucleotide nucleotidyltransferase [Candidatus Polarisedimenticolia bacterium]|nr:polyribonucleotide nucleotidyltransferase [Candidatus Polarisedimenticolia bacterium]
MTKTHSIEFGGRTLTIETGKVAKQADGAVTVRYGDTVVLVTATAERREKPGISFLPLTVDYRENTYAAGKIPGGFFKREGRPNEKETLTSRLIDRPVRPLFPKGWSYETQVIALVLSADLANDPDVLAVTGASAALHLSDIPFVTPIAAVRVGLLDGEYVLNPTYEQMEASRLDLVVVGSATEVVMVEAGASEVSEREVLDAIWFGQQHCSTLVEMQEEMRRQSGKPKRVAKPRELDQELYRQIESACTDRLYQAMKVPVKIDSYRQVAAIEEEQIRSVPEDQPLRRQETALILHDLHKKIARRELLGAHRRFDNRASTQIRPVTCEASVLPRTHGSALFTRGETQALVTCTLGTSEDVQRLDWLEGESEKRFMLHYNFPPFSVGEVKFLRGPGRREIGHGALAERALLPLMPGQDEFPYTIRLVSDILESNGSSSMASICGGSLCLMDAGVPLRSAVAGAAMGLVKEGDTYVILTDIAGVEDHYGDMDFKVAGTREGITALQMDIKIQGISKAIMQEALAQARDARLSILDVMGRTLTAPRANISSFAPRIFTIRINKDKIREVIGPGGKMIRSIIERTGCKIDVEDDGRINIASVDETSAKKAIEIIQEITAEAEIGRTYTGKVTRIVNFGAFVEILPGIEGLLHISELAEHRVKEVQDEIREGEEIPVKVIEVDGDRIRLSRKALLREKRIEKGEPAPPGASDGDADAGSRGRRPFGGGHGRRHQSSRHR